MSSELSYERKFKEILLALRIERTFTKDRILELYLNEIFLGNRSYGVAAAALNYFDKSLDELTIAEAALLAGLPKAPSSYDPIEHPDAALARRDYVLTRMRDDGYITPAEAAAAARRADRPAQALGDPDRRGRLLHRGGTAPAGRTPRRAGLLRGRPLGPCHRSPRPCRRPPTGPCGMASPPTTAGRAGAVPGARSTSRPPAMLGSSS